MDEINSKRRRINLGAPKIYLIEVPLYELPRKVDHERETLVGISDYHFSTLVRGCLQNIIDALRSRFMGPPKPS